MKAMGMALLCSAGFMMGASTAEARSLSDCKMAWSKAVRSYLSQNRSAGPDGTVPASIEDKDRVDQAWLDAFTPACEQEAKRDKRGARLTASATGAQVLQRLDPKACQRFLSYYMRVKDADVVCAAASTEGLKPVKEALKSRIR